MDKVPYIIWNLVWKRGFHWGFPMHHHLFVIRTDLWKKHISGKVFQTLNKRTEWNTYSGNSFGDEMWENKFSLLSFLLENWFFWYYHGLHTYVYSGTASSAADESCIFKVNNVLVIFWPEHLNLFWAFNICDFVWMCMVWCSSLFSKT